MAAHVPEPPSRAAAWDDHRIEVIVADLLRAGVALAAAIVFSGACIYLVRHSHEPADYRVFKGEPAEFSTISGVFHSVLRGRGRGFIQLGLLILIATPIARVAISIVGFSLQRDRMYVGFALIVLLVLLYSLLGSGLGV
jgi:uncharacterized membrane protein